MVIFDILNICVHSSNNVMWQVTDSLRTKFLFTNLLSTHWSTTEEAQFPGINGVLGRQITFKITPCNAQLLTIF